MKRLEQKGDLEHEKGKEYEDLDHVQVSEWVSAIPARIYYMKFIVRIRQQSFLTDCTFIIMFLTALYRVIRMFADYILLTLHYDPHLGKNAVSQFDVNKR